jgi:hypothetical protein
LGLHAVGRGEKSASNGSLSEISARGKKVAFRTPFIAISPVGGNAYFPDSPLYQLHKRIWDMYGETYVVTCTTCIWCGQSQDPRMKAPMGTSVSSERFVRAILICQTALQSPIDDLPNLVPWIVTAMPDSRLSRKSQVCVWGPKKCPHISQSMLFLSIYYVWKFGCSVYDPHLWMRYLFPQRWQGRPECQTAHGLWLRQVSGEFPTPLCVAAW